MFGVRERCVAVERVDRRQAGVAGLGAAVARGFQVGQERGDQSDVEIGEVELAGLALELLGGEGDQESERVAGLPRRPPRPARGAAHP